MKKLFIIPGWDGSPTEPIHVWLKEKLEKTGNWEVEVLEMPDSAQPKIEPWLKALQEKIAPAENVFLLGHSVGGNAVLRYLDQTSLENMFGGVVLLAPWMKLDEETIKEEGEEVVEIARPWEETPIDFENVKTKAKSFTAIFSDNDPFVPLSNADVFRDNLGATIFVEKGQFHFDYGSGVVEVPKALEVFNSL